MGSKLTQRILDGETGGVNIVRVKPVGDGSGGLVENIAFIRLGDPADAHAVVGVAREGFDQMLAHQRDAEAERSHRAAFGDVAVAGAVARRRAASSRRVSASAGITGRQHADRLALCVCPEPPLVAVVAVPLSPLELLPPQATSEKTMMSASTRESTFFIFFILLSYRFCYR